MGLKLGKQNAYKGKITHVLSSRWYPVANVHYLQCCECGLKHLVEMKVDKQKKVWMRVWL